MSSATEDLSVSLASRAHSRRLELARCLDEAVRLGADRDACAVLRQKLQDLSFNLVIAGQFKRGKSSVLNALLGEEVLPVGVIPLTSVVTVIRSGSVKSAFVEFNTGTEQPIPLEDLGSYVTERGNPHNALAVRQVVIEHPSPWLTAGVRLIDTPGIGSVYEHNTDVAQQYLPNADAVLFTASVDQPLSRAELDFLVGIRHYADKIFCILNKVDYLSAAELADSVAFVSEQLRANLQFDVPLFAVSARAALQAKKHSDALALAKSGFVDLEESLRRFLSREKDDTLMRSIGRSLRRLLSQSRFAHELEAQVLTAPQERLDANLAAFGRKRLELERARSDHLVLLEAAAKTLFDNEIVAAIEQFSASEQRRMRSDVPQWYAELAALPLRALQAALEQRMFSEIRLAYDTWLARQDRVMTEAFSALCDRAWGSLQSTVDELIRYSGELFAVSFQPVVAESHWSTESKFYYKFWYEPTSLRMLSSALLLSLPKTLAKRPLIRRTVTQGIELTDTQAGRIRHDLQERLKASVLDVQHRISATAESIVAHIELAIEEGVQTRTQSAVRVESRARELEAQVEQHIALEREIDAACG
jgi:GTP-binding protein EngB required for normal cell division